MNEESQITPGSDETTPRTVNKGAIGLYLMHGMVTHGEGFDRDLKMQIIAENPEVLEAWETLDAFITEASADISTGQLTSAAHVLAGAIERAYFHFYPEGLPSDLNLEQLQLEYLIAVMGEDSPEVQALRFQQMVADTPAASLEELEEVLTSPAPTAEPGQESTKTPDAPTQVVTEVVDVATPEDWARFKRTMFSTIAMGVVAGVVIGASGYYLYTLYREGRTAPIVLTQDVIPNLSSP